MGNNNNDLMFPPLDELTSDEELEGTGGFRFIEKVLNGSKYIFHDDDTGHFYRTLRGARNYLSSDRIRHPKNVNHRFSYISGGRWRKKTADEMEESFDGLVDLLTEGE